MNIGYRFIVVIAVVFTLLIIFPETEGSAIGGNTGKRIKGNDNDGYKSNSTNRRVQTGVRRSRQKSYSGKHQRGGEIRPGYSGSYSNGGEEIRLGYFGSHSNKY